MIKTNKLLTLKFFIFNGKKILIRGMRFVLACLCFFSFPSHFCFVSCLILHGSVHTNYFHFNVYYSLNLFPVFQQFLSR